MATWQELASDSLEAAKKLLGEGHLRSSVSRSYYAAYSALSHELGRKNVAFAHGWNNPSHQQLTSLIRNGLRLAPADRQRLLASIRRLRMARQEADYRPGATVGRLLAVDCVRDAFRVLDILELNQ